jgi:hypothetical protein
MRGADKKMSAIVATVFLMRRRKFLGIGEALDVMHEARTVYWSEEAAENIESNWRALMQVHCISLSRRR